MRGRNSYTISWGSKQMNARNFSQIIGLVLPWERLSKRPIWSLNLGQRKINQWLRLIFFYLASRVELCPQGNPDPLAEMVTLMREQATCIQKLERNMERMRDAVRCDIASGIANIGGVWTVMSPDVIGSAVALWNPVMSCFTRYKDTVYNITYTSREVSVYFWKSRVAVCNIT